MTSNLTTRIKKNIVLDVQELIKDGLIQGYKQNILFTQNYSDLQSRVIEYLIVVNVAQNLEKFSFQNDIYINLEYSLNDFYNNAFPLFIFEGGVFDQKYIGRKKHSPEDSKSKRIDIVLTSDSRFSGEWGTTQKSLIGIEIKSINQSDKKIRKDVNRMAQAVSLKDEIGINSIQACFTCFFKRFDNDNSTLTSIQIDNKTSFEKKNWQKYFEEMAYIYPELLFELIDTSIVNIPAEEFRNFSFDPEADYGDLITNTGCINAYMIKVVRK
ncbi:hypothetical protein C8C83_0508 [Flavobacterium sp. 90]|uniref:hypothetical protein n=1 Tax=unclassified Flavobacterium TaxID=196869 RepID=UPI000EAF113E|nr:MULTISPECIES: hypothetical protein [unclassified Flavobacterium]RKR08913.1 hypothetical protein C8C82_0803 [Flavobacterium sp. 81]TCK52701.1 hypothetical protein C8C83_0508 [Flavobacterium sp. 90]